MSGTRLLLALFLATAGAVSSARPAAGQDPPPLPPGLEEPEESPPPVSPEPALPPGLGDGSTQEEPSLPAGLGGENTDSQDTGADEEDTDEPWITFQPRGFFEMRGGAWLHSNPDQRDGSVGEGRLQLGTEAFAGPVAGRLTVDLLTDAVAESQEIDLSTGEGFIDVREANIAFTPLSSVDVRIGRQVLTWGTGDLIFINDLFPKDYNSFFIGRDVEYLKAPSDAVRVSAYHDVVNIDVVYTPRFDADRFVDGSRVSYYDPESDAIVGRSGEIDPDVPSSWFEDDEWAIRLFRRFGAVEAALYGYYGRHKSPTGFDPDAGRAIFPPLAVTGASVRSPWQGGIANAEVGHYDSLDDRSGDDPDIPNGQFRALVGYEREIATELTLGLQYSLEHRLEQDAYEDSLPAGMPEGDENRHVLTARLTKLLMRQDLELSLFGFWSPSDQDAYLRPRVSYQFDDHWSAEIGANLFFGAEDSTFFGQFEESSNVYAAVRYGF